MRQILLPLFFVFSLVSCQDDSQKAADELCDCLTSKAKGFSSDFKKLMDKIGESEVPSKTFKTEFEKFDEEEKTAMQVEVNKLIKIDEASIQSCSKKITDYKVRGKNEEERQKKVLELMADQSGCEIGSAQWALAMEQMYDTKARKTDDTEEEETEKPKKKKATEEEEEL